MRLRLSLVVLVLALAAPAQMKLSVEQLVSFLKSSVDLRHQDRNVADYLEKVQLTERLEEPTINMLVAYGVGPRTVRALESLREASKALPGPRRVEPAAPKPPAPPPASEQSGIIERVREYALSYTRQLPNFICVQVTRRFYDPTGLEFWRSQDVITMRLSFFEQKEDYQVVLVNNRPADISYEALGGTTTRGEFGSMLKEIFEPETETSFQWERWATLRGRRVYVYRYQVEQPRSKWTARYQDLEPIVVGYHGLLYIDRDTLAVMRIRMEAETPPSFPVQEITNELDYDFVEISGQNYMLPLKHTVRSREGRELRKNEVEYRLYRKFAADASISFETPEPLPEDQIQEQPVVP